MAGKITFAFREQLDGMIGGDHHNYCLQCGACVASCPAARYSPDFNPRTILLRTLLGQEEELIAADSVIWLCTNCYTCYERCPQDVRPIEVIIALKNMAAERGVLPEDVDKLAEMISSKGHSAVLSESVNRRRERLGLSPIPRVPVEELAAILAEPEEGESPSRGVAGGKTEVARERGRALNPSAAQSAAEESSTLTSEVVAPPASKPVPTKAAPTKEPPTKRALGEKTPTKKRSGTRAPRKGAGTKKPRTKKRSKK